MTIPKAVVDGMVYQTLWQSAYHDNEAVEALIYDRFILQAGNGGMNATDLTRVMSSYRDAVNGTIHSALTSCQSTLTMIETALTTPELQPYIRPVWQAFAGPMPLEGIDQAPRLGSSASAQLA